MRDFSYPKLALGGQFRKWRSVGAHFRKIIDDLGGGGFRFRRGDHITSLSSSLRYVSFYCTPTGIVYHFSYYVTWTHLFIEEVTTQ